MSEDDAKFTAEVQATLDRIFLALEGDRIEVALTALSFALAGTASRATKTREAAGELIHSVATDAQEQMRRDFDRFRSLVPSNISRSGEVH